MVQHRSGHVIFRIATVLMILLGLGNGMLDTLLEKFFPALDPQAAAQVTSALLTLWLVTLVIWITLLLGWIRSKRPGRRSAGLRKRVSSRQQVEYTCQGQSKQDGLDPAWSAGINDTRERTDRTDPSAPGRHSAPAISGEINVAGEPGLAAGIALPPPSDWSLALLQELEWRRFDRVCAGFLESLGLETKALAGGPDSQVSLQVWQPGVTHMHAIAKTQAGTATVEVERLRALFRLQKGYQLDKAFFLSAGSFSSHAMAVGHDTGLVLIDGMAMLAHIRTMPRAQRAALLVSATSGDYRSPTCPACSVKMVICRDDANTFWRCSDYPVCTSRLPLSGNNTLPD